jgi:hypothetical protein
MLHGPEERHRNAKALKVVDRAPTSAVQQRLSLAPFPDGMHERQPAAGHVEVHKLHLLNIPACDAGPGWRGAQLLEPRPVTVLDKVSNSIVAERLNSCLINSK